MEPPRNFGADFRSSGLERRGLGGPVETMEAGSPLARALCVFWMSLVFVGFLVIRVLGSESFRGLHLFGKAH
jgi:hypothetical protein